jgi:hypothetical protein
VDCRVSGKDEGELAVKVKRGPVILSCFNFDDKGCSNIKLDKRMGFSSS